MSVIERVRRVCVFSLHPTRDVIMETPRLALGEVGRAASWFSYPAGKALNAARTAGQLGGHITAVVLAPPHWRDQLCKFLTRYRVKLRHVPVPGEGRICVLLNEPRRETVINTDLHMKISREDFSLLARTVQREARRAGYVVFAGSLPPALGRARWRKLLQLATATSSALVLDQTGRNLQAGLRFHPWLIKPNLKEFHHLIGRSTRSWVDLLACVEEVRRQGVQRVLLSLGARGCLLASPAGRWYAPAIRAVRRTGSAGLSPVGSGDALLGGFLYAVAAGEPEPEAMRWGVAAAAANLVHRGACLMRVGEIRALYRRAQVRGV